MAEKEFYIIPKKDVEIKITGKDKEDAIINFATIMDTDMNQYFRVVTKDELIGIKEYNSDRAGHERFVTAFMKTTLIDDFDVPEEDAGDLAEEAYEIYCRGNGQTEYECIEEAFEEYEQEQNKEI